jgi:hypothetical protein
VGHYVVVDSVAPPVIKVRNTSHGNICGQKVDGNGTVIDYEFLKGLNDEVVIKEVGLVADNVIQTFHFKSPYMMASHGDVENGLNWADGNIPYDQLFNVLDEAVAGYANL